MQLHNSVCQTLTGVDFHLSALAGRMRKTCPECSDELEKLQRLIGRARAELHDIVRKIPL